MWERMILRLSVRQEEVHARRYALCTTCALKRAPEDCVVITVEGNAFLYNMVRIIAGTLAGVGQGDLAPDVIQRMLDTGDRKLGGVTAPPQGLILEQIEYETSKPAWVR